MSRKTINVDAEIHKKAAELAKKTGYPISKIIELLLNDTSEAEIMKLYKQSVKENK